MEECKKVYTMLAQLLKDISLEAWLLQASSINLAQTDQNVADLQIQEGLAQPSLSQKYVPHAYMCCVAKGACGPQALEQTCMLCCYDGCTPCLLSY